MQDVWKNVEHTQSRFVSDIPCQSDSQSRSDVSIYISR